MELNWLNELIATMRKLRSPDGCPWDKEQNHASLKEYLAEEAAELFDAIDEGDDESMKEELGDVLLQVIFHARIAEEEDRFTIEDIAKTCCEKLWRRHPHVFGEVEVDNAAAVLRQWDEIKKKEKDAPPESAVSNVPRHLPALHRAQKMQKKAAKTGFDWSSSGEVFAKVEEELEELRQEIEEDDSQGMAEEIGDLLFAVVNMSRYQNHFAEELLHTAVRKFEIRFKKMEDRIQESGRELNECTIDELEDNWQAIK